MKFWAYYSLVAFGLSFVASLVTFAVVKYPPKPGEVATAAFLVLTSIALVGAVLSKFVGFGNAAIPQDQRGIIAAIRALSVPMRIAVVVGIGYAVGILSTSHYVSVRTQLNSYYIEVPAKEGESSRTYVSEGNTPIRRERVPEDVAFRYKWQWPRTYTAVAAAINVVCAGFFFSRAARQSPELKEKQSQGMFPAQVDDTIRP